MNEIIKYFFNSFSFSSNSFLSFSFCLLPLLPIFVLNKKSRIGLSSYTAFPCQAINQYF